MAHAPIISGTYSGSKRLYLPDASGAIVEHLSPSQLAATPVAGRFTELEYTWSYKDKLNTGLLIVGVDDAGHATAAWCDSWHQSSAVLFLTGTAQSGSIAVSGTYPAPPGPDWGWRVTLTPGPRTLRIEMTNITPAPERAEHPAVLFELTRA